MAYVTESFVYRASLDLLTCPQVYEFEASDTPYLSVDFSDVLRQNDLTISSAGVPSEVDSKTITIADVSLSPQSDAISMKLSGWTTGTDYTISVPYTLSDGTTNVKSKRIRVRVK